MITEWMEETAGSEVKKLMEINGDFKGEIGGYGLKQRVERLIGLLQATLYPSIYVIIHKEKLLTICIP